MPRITLEQWSSLIAVVEEGGYAQAASRLHKSQSSITYSIQKLESLLGIDVFMIEGRRAVLTAAGEMLYRRAKQLLDDATGLEQAAGQASAGWESQISIAVEALFPTWLLLECLDRFGEKSPQTRIELYETVLDGGLEILKEGLVDFAISPKLPAGFEGEQLASSINVIPVAHPEHPLHLLGRPLSLRDLRRYRHLVIRDSSPARNTKTGTVDVARRWTVSNMATSIDAVSRGYGFAWLPEERIRVEMERGHLKALPLAGGRSMTIPLYLIYRDRDAMGPGASLLSDMIRQAINVL